MIMQLSVTKHIKNKNCLDSKLIDLSTRNLYTYNKKPGLLPGLIGSCDDLGNRKSG